MKTTKISQGENAMKYPSAYTRELEAKIARLESRRYKSAGDEHSLAFSKAQLAVNPEKFRVGDYVSYSFGYGKQRQTNRGFQIIAVDRENRRVNLRQVKDTGLTITGGCDRIPAHWVEMALIKFDNVLKREMQQ